LILTTIVDTLKVSIPISSQKNYYLRLMTKKIILAVLIFASLAYIIRGCLRSDEDTIRDMLAESKEWAEEKDLFHLFDHFDKNFIDDSGLSRDDIKMIAFRVFQQCEKVEVRYQEISISVNGDTALLIADIYLYLTEAGERSEIFKPVRYTNRFEVTLSKKEGQWKFIESKIPG
jgi:ketosteroid isomerase-like protein